MHHDPAAPSPDHPTSESNDGAMPPSEAEACSRRRFLAAGVAGVAGVSSLASAADASRRSGDTAARTDTRTTTRGATTRRPPVVVASGNGLGAVERAYELLVAGVSPCVAVVEGVKLNEADPRDQTVGLGGLPNEDGVVQLDASVMDGPSHKAGSVAALEHVVHASEVALRVLDSTDHVMLVGDGAYKFARAMGFPHQDLLTERSRQWWIRRRRGLSPNDDWLDDDQRIPLREPERPARDPLETIPFTWGTIHCGAVNGDGDVGACTTTSGLSGKIAGRVGDSPIIGAGMYVHNDVGAAGATGRGESLIQSCGAYEIVRRMEEGVEPAEACVQVLRRIARNTKRRDLLDAAGWPNFGALVYAVRRDGAYGAASLRGGNARFAVCDADGPRLERCVSAMDD